MTAGGVPGRPGAGDGAPVRGRRARTSFAELTDRGRARRLRALTLAALAHYDLDFRSVSLVANHLNGIFRVDAVGRTLALRISHPTWRTDDDLRAELVWLRALHRDTDIGAPVPVPARDGRLVVTVCSDGVPQPRRCVLMGWLPGPDLADRLSERGVFDLGRLAARLHAHAAGWQPPAGFAARTMTGIYARGEPDVLLRGAGQGAVADRHRAVLEQAGQRVGHVHAALMSVPARLHAVHADLNQGNVKLFRGRLRPLDFEDVVVGHPVQDIASTFGDLLFHSRLTNGEYRRMRDAFARGYTSLRAWPEAEPGQIDACMAGRLVWRANYAVRFQPERAARFVAWVAERLRDFLEAGVMRK